MLRDLAGGLAATQLAGSDMTLWWILGSGLAMSAIALVGGLTAVLRPQTLQRVLLPLVAFAAGSLLGGALFHLLPSAIEMLGNGADTWGWVAAGFLAFFVLEQFLHWHHCHDPEHRHVKPLAWLVLCGDGLHNFIGGLAVGAVFLADIRLGLTAWIAAAAHELPQELGDFGVLVHGGMRPRRALALNFASALTFPLGGLLAWSAAGEVDVAVLIPLGAGNFLYIACADLIPEVKRADRLAEATMHAACFVAGLALLALLGAGRHSH